MGRRLAPGGRTLRHPPGRARVVRESSARGRVGHERGQARAGRPRQAAAGLPRAIPGKALSVSGGGETLGCGDGHAGARVMAVPHLFGPGGFWQTYDWGSAIADGMKTVGLRYSGSDGWVETDMYWKVNHMVVPRATALQCAECHGDQGRLDWKALGDALP